VETINADPEFLANWYYHHPSIYKSIHTICKYDIKFNYELHKIGVETSPEFISFFYNENYNGNEFSEDLMYNLFSNHYVSRYMFKCKHLNTTQYFIAHLNFFKMVYFLLKRIPLYSFMYCTVLTKNGQKEFKYGKVTKTFY
jgi:hypothetical protein